MDFAKVLIKYQNGLASDDDLDASNFITSVGPGPMSHNNKCSPKSGNNNKSKDWRHNKRQSSLGPSRKHRIGPSGARSKSNFASGWRAEREARESARGSSDPRESEGHDTFGETETETEVDSATNSPQSIAHRIARGKIDPASETKAKAGVDHREAKPAPTQVAEDEDTARGSTEERGPERPQPSVVVQNRQLDEGTEDRTLSVLVVILVVILAAIVVALLLGWWHHNGNIAELQQQLTKLNLQLARTLQRVQTLQRECAKPE